MEIYSAHAIQWIKSGYKGLLLQWYFQNVAHEFRIFTNNYMKHFYLFIVKTSCNNSNTNKRD